MECGVVRVAGLGFRTGARLESLRDALAGAEVNALATVADKAADPALRALAEVLGVEIIPVPAERLAGMETLTHSARAWARYRTGSLAEAAALCAAGPEARLVGARAASPDRLAMVAIAERSGA
jgi:cobalt-precorrin 5A hydrolase